MKKLSLIIILVLFITATLKSQSCLPDGINFTTQEQIDDFHINYPDCTEIEGDVTIGGWSEIGMIKNLNGLNVLTSIQGNLVISYTDSLITLTGLDNLTSVGGGVILGTYWMDAMLGNFHCEGNSSLTSLDGLNNLVYVGGNLGVFCNESLTSLAGLNNLITIEGDLNIGTAKTGWIFGGITSAGNKSITTMSGLENLSYVGGDLKIEGNTALTTLSGLNNEVSIGGNLSVKYNETLSKCETKSICDYLVNPNGVVEIHSNSEGCDNLVEVANNCGITLSCLPYGNYYFLNQSDIDEFQTNFPLCNEINGDVDIYGSDITNLNGLSSITSIYGDLRIGKEVIGINPVLMGLSGLEGLTSIGGDLSISGNDTLTTLSELNNLTSIGGRLLISFNDRLSNLEGLENIDAASITDLEIYFNDTLANCVVKSICNYLATPNSNRNIHGNSHGCNGSLEVDFACAFLTVPKILMKGQCNAYPNPFTTSTTIEYQLNQPETVSINFYNQFGKQVDIIRQDQSQGLNKIVWTPENLTNGVYYFRLQAGELVAAGKVVLMK